MSRYAPISSEEARELRENAAELGISVDELRRRMSAELEALRPEPEPWIAKRWAPKLTEAEIELGRRELARIRAELEARKAKKHSNPTEEVTP